MQHPKPRGAHTNKCPHCKAPAVCYASRRVSDLVTDRYVQCTNIDCGHQYVVQIGVLRTIVPSLAPDPKINIPMVERRANDITVTRADQATTMTETAVPVPAHGRVASSALSAH